MKSPCLPDLHRRIRASRGDARAIGGPGQGLYSTSMSIVSEDMAPVSGIPHLHCIIAAIAGPRSDIPAIGRPGQGRDDTRMAAIGEDMAPVSGIPHLDRLIFPS